MMRSNFGSLNARLSIKLCGILILAGGVLLNIKLILDSKHHNQLARDAMLTNLFYNEFPMKPGKVLKYVPRANERDIERETEQRLRASSAKKIILLWSPSRMVEDLIDIPERERCGNCEVAYDRSMINDPRTGAVVYHFVTDESPEMPINRNPNHLQIFWSMESSGTVKNYYRKSLDKEESFGMNATMSYRLESDFLMSYRNTETLVNQMGQNDSIYKTIMKLKSKFAVAAISNCGYTPGARLRYALMDQLLRAGLKIEIYGRCFSNRANREFLFKTIPQFKFYFAYENSYHCKDYVTEKLFAFAMSQGTVPVVWGATKADYMNNTPPESFIFAEDFKSPTHLIEYLEYLDRHEEEYLKYFRWRTLNPEDHLPFSKRAQGFCSICRALHGINSDNRFHPKLQHSITIPLFSDGVAKRTIPSLKRYIFDDDNAECFKKWDWL